MSVWDSESYSVEIRWSVREVVVSGLLSEPLSFLKKNNNVIIVIFIIIIIIAHYVEESSHLDVFADCVGKL